jgi:hypothetical protein
VATEADKIFEALADKFTGEVNAKEFIEKIFFGENPDYLTDFHDRFKKELFNPVKNRLGVVFKMIQRRVDNITPDVVDRINEPFDDLKDFSNEVKNKTDEWLAKLDEKYKKLLETDDNIPSNKNQNQNKSEQETESKNKQNSSEIQEVLSTKPLEILPQTIQQAAANREKPKSIQQQKGFDPEVQIVEFDEKTEGFFKSLFSKFKSDDTSKKNTKDSTKQGFSYGGILADGIQILLAGVAGLVGAFMTDGPLKGTLELIGKGGLRGGLALLSKTMFGSFAKTALKKVPVIGALYSYGLAYQRLNSGDTIGGILDIASGTASLFPGVGTALSIGIDVLQAVLDAKSGGSSAQASSKKLTILADWGKKLGDYLYKFPLVKSIVDFGDGMWKFFSGEFGSDMLKSMSAIPVFGIFPALLQGLIDGVNNSQGKDGKIDFNKFSDGFSKTIKRAILSWVPNVPMLRQYVADQLGIPLNEPDKPVNNNQIINLSPDGIKDLKEQTKKQVEKNGWSQDVDDMNEKTRIDAENQMKEFLDKNKRFNPKKDTEESWHEKTFNELMQSTIGIFSRKAADNAYRSTYNDIIADRMQYENLRQNLERKKLESVEYFKYKPNNLEKDRPKSPDFKTSYDNLPSSPSTKTDTSLPDNKKQLSNNTEQGSVKINDEVFSIKDSQGTRYVPHKDDTLVVSKPDGALNKTLIEIKQVMINVHNGIKELSKKEEKILKTEDKIFNITNQTNSTISNSRDPIYSSRNEWWAMTSNRGVIV